MTVTKWNTQTLSSATTIAPGDTVYLDPTQNVTITTSTNIINQGIFQSKPATPAIKHKIKFTAFDETSFVGGGDVPLSTDVGLWTTGAGKLDLVGAPKVAFIQASNSLAAGTKVIYLESAPTGWKVGDEVAIAPTQSPLTPKINNVQFYAQFDTSTISKVDLKGKKIVLSTPMLYPHPVVIINGTPYGAEVVNLSRNVMIEGEGLNNHSHVWIKSSTPQNIQNVAGRYLAPQGVKGRYGLHFHKNGDDQTAVTVSGCVVRDSEGPCYVPHASNYMTFDSCVSYNTFEDVFWYDSEPDGFTPGVDTPQAPHDLIYRGCGSFLTRSNGGVGTFWLGYVANQIGEEGPKNSIFDCVGVGAQGGGHSSTYHWPEGQIGVWNFSNNLVHNNQGSGVFVWQNTAKIHPVDTLVSYHNGNAGIEHGAYSNNYQYDSAILFGNNTCGVALHSESKTGLPPTTFSNCDIIGNNITNYGYLLFQPTNTNGNPVVVCGGSITGLRNGTTDDTKYHITYTGPDSNLSDRLTIQATCTNAAATQSGVNAPDDAEFIDIASGQSSDSRTPDTSGGDKTDRTDPDGSRRSTGDIPRRQSEEN